MNAPGPRCYAFGRFRFDPLHGELTRGAARIELRPRSLAVLQYLLAHPHRLVTKEELLEAVWGKVVVTEDSLVQCVREIRQALGDTDQRLIRTIPRGGYVFAGDVSEQLAAPFGEPARPATIAEAGRAASSRLAAMGRGWWIAAVSGLAAATVVTALVVRGPAGEPGSATRATAAPLSIVVLPLDNIDRDPAYDYFADGLTTDLTTDLGRIPTSFVLSFNTARAYRGREVDSRQVGRELGVRYVLEGSVQRLNGDVRVNLRLVDAESGAQRWAERFEAPRSDLPRMQADIVRRVAGTLKAQLLEAAADRSARERTVNPTAQDLIMRGWALWDRRRPADNVAARDLFTQATQADPKSSLAWVGLANTHVSDLHAGWSDDREASLNAAAQAVSVAYDVGPRHRDVNAVRGYVLFFEGNVESALAAFDEEIENNAGNALAHVWRGLMLITTGRPAEALPSIERAIALSPRDVDLNVFFRSMAHANFSLGRFGEAQAWSQKAVGHSAGYAKGYAFLAASAALNGDGGTAAKAAESVMRLQPKYSSVAAFRQTLMPGELRMFDATPRFWEALQKAGLPAGDESLVHSSASRHRSGP
jgi:TolB-like protein/DNA-binding winged helix-turn-helix (wHTH) protein/Tfp pilus assembly protein PilF